MKRFLLLALLCPVLTVACNTSRPLTDVSTTTNAEDKPTIVFMFCNIESNEGFTKVSIKEQREKPGYLKSASKQGRPNKNALIAVFFDKEQTLFDISLQHPLRPSFEVVQKDAHENVSKELKKAEFSLRFQKDKSITHVLFIQQLEGKTDTLNTIPIQK